MLSIFHRVYNKQIWSLGCMYYPTKINSKVGRGRGYWGLSYTVFCISTASLSDHPKCDSYSIVTEDSDGYSDSDLPSLKKSSPSSSFVSFGLVLCVVTSGGRLEGTCLASAWTEFGFFVFLTISGFTPETEPIALNIYRPEGQVMQCSD